jgi:membrane peptidoglycan carboxypeptidase
VKLRRNVGPVVPLDNVLGWAPWDAASPTAPTRRRAMSSLLLAILVCGLLVAGVAAPAAITSGLATRSAAEWWNDLPTTLPDTPLPQRSTILAADGSPIAEFYSENRVNVTLDQVPQRVRDAIISIEDSRFYSHTGVDVRGTVRALFNNLTGGPTQGGSTLTQQYIKNVLLLSATSAEQRDNVAGQNYDRKIREAKIALSIEQTMTKDQILEGYLNVASFGDGAYGIGTAAQHYFSKNPTDLTIAESALLAGLVKNPRDYNPTEHPGAAIERRDIVLQRMLDLQAITPDEFKQATIEPLTLHVMTPANGCSTSRYPFYCQWIKQTLADDPAFGDTAETRAATLYRGGMVIHTTLDPHAQDIAQDAVDDALGRDNRVAAASVTVTPGTGAVVAMAVNRDYGQAPGQTELLLPTLPAYQSGSTFKVFTLAAALEQGYNLNTVYDAPTRYSPPGLNSPSGGFRNSSAVDAGPMNAATALWRSSNTFFVHLEADTGVLAVADMAQRLGITSLPRTGDKAITPKDASLTLGSYEVSPLEMAAANAVFAAHGVACRPTGIASITTLDGQPLPAPNQNCHQAIAPGVADTVASVMQGTLDGPDAFRTGANQSLGRPAGAKTGTTNGFAAVWMTGFTPQYSTAVWVGDPRGGQKYPLTGIYAYGRYVATAWGGETAGPIWKQVMLGLHEGLPVQAFAPTDAIVATGLPYTVPDVAGMPRDRAIQVLTDAGFTVTINPATAPADPALTNGQVAASNPAAGSRVSFGGAVTLTLSSGSVTDVTIPDDATRPR